MASITPSPSDWANLLDTIGTHAGKGRIVYRGIGFSFALHPTERTLKYQQVIDISKRVWATASLEDKKKIFQGLNQIIAKKEKELETYRFINKYLKSKKLAQMKFQFEQTTQHFIDTPTRTGFYEGERFIGRIQQDGITYEGTFVEGRPEGRCKVTDKEGNIFEGTCDALGRLSGRVEVTGAAGQQVEETFTPELSQRKLKAKMKGLLLDLPEIERTFIYTMVGSKHSNESIKQAVSSGLKGEKTPETIELQRKYEGFKLTHQAITRADHAKRLLARTLASESPIPGLQTEKEQEGVMHICRHRRNYAEYCVSLDSKPSSLIVKTMQDDVDLLDHPSSDRVVQLEDGSTFFSFPGGWTNHLVSYGFQKKGDEYFFILFNRGAGADDIRLHGPLKFHYQGKIYAKTTVVIKTTQEMLRNADFLNALVKAKIQDSEPHVYHSIYRYFIEARRGSLVKSEEERLLEQLQAESSSIGPELMPLIIQFMDLDPNFHSYQLFGTCVESNGTTMEKWMAPASTRTTLKLSTLATLTDHLARETFSSAAQEIDKTVTLHQLTRVKQGLETKLTAPYKFVSPELLRRFPQPINTIIAEMINRLQHQPLPNLTNVWDYRSGADTPLPENRLDKELRLLNRTLIRSSERATILAKRGNIYLLQSKWEQAISDFNQSLSLKADKPSLLARLGEAYRLKGDLDKALEYLNQALVLNRHYPYALEKRAHVYFLKNNPAKALKDIHQLEHRKIVPDNLEDVNAALAINPNDVEQLNLRGNFYSQEGLVDLAIRDYTAAIAIEPDPQNLMNRTILYVQQEQYDEALADLEAILRLDATKLKDLNLDYPRERIKGLKDLKRLNATIMRNPWDATTLIERGNCLLVVHCLSEEGGCELALKDFEAALIMDPSNKEALNMKLYTLLRWSEKLLKKGDVDGALNHVSAVLAIDPQNKQALTKLTEIILNQSDISLARKSFHLTIQALNAILALDPHHHLALMKRANVHQMQGEIDLALADLELLIHRADSEMRKEAVAKRQALIDLKNLNATITHHSCDIKALVKRGDWHLRNDNPRLALKDFDAAIAFRSDSLDSDNLAAKKEALLKRGDLHLQYGRPHLALKDFDSVLQLDPHDQTALAKKREVIEALA